MSDQTQILKNIALEKYLKANVEPSSDSSYLASVVPGGEGNFYNAYRAIPGTADKIRFNISTVNENGENVVYTYHNQSLLGMTLFINPTSMTSNLAKMVNRTPTMTGWIEDHWGEELDTITFTGSSAAFIWGGPASNQPINGPLKKTPEEIRQIFNNYMDIPDLGTNEPLGSGETSGLTVKRRRDTLSYDEFRKLIFLMNGNGFKYDSYGLVRSRFYIRLSYDLAAYTGYFESMDITETADMPFRFIYTITFKSEKTLFSFLG